MVFDLDFYSALYVPSDACLPNLKTFRLKYIEFLNDESVRRLFSSCPVLEVLHIVDCRFQNLRELNITNPSVKSLLIRGDSLESRCSPFRLVINVPNLVYFKYSDFMADDISMAYMHSLVEADIHILLYDEYSEPDITDEKLLVQVQPVNQFLQAIVHVKILRLVIDYPGVS